MNPPAAAAPPVAVPADAAQMKGPTGYSNWVFLNSLLVGAHPYEVDDQDTILMQNCRLFVCLETDKELQRSNSYYIERLKKMLLKNHKKYPQQAADLEFLHFEIYDRSVAADEEVLKLVVRLEQELASGRRIFMHCRGGHGRTGTIVSLLIGRRYGLSAYEALELCQAYHDTRGMISSLVAIEDVIMRGLGYYRSPETHEQRDQVYRLLK